MTRYVFEQVSAPAERKVRCPSCNRKRTIRRTFIQTVNPFNKNDDGTIKTWAEVREAVKAEAAAWEPVSRELYHGACWQVAPARSGDDS